MKVSRRDLLKAGVASGAGALLGAEGLKLMNQAMAQGEGAYPLVEPENIIYGLCLQCHTECTLKIKLQDGLVAKIDGNPYSPGNLQPQLDYTAPPELAAKVDGSICPKGQAGVQTQYDPYRIRKVLKRAGPRGSGKWKAIPFEQAIEEIVNGGKLFAEIGDDRVYPGFKDVFKLKDAKLAKEMAADVAAIRAGKMTVEAFKKKHKDHLDVLIDPDHPDLGPKNNQFVFMAGRIEHGRKEFAKRFTFGGLGSINWYAHTTICEQAHHVAFKYATAQWVEKLGKYTWKKGKDHMKPDFEGAEFVIFWGTGFAEANFGPPPMSPQITQAAVDGKLKFAVVDPRLSKSAAHGWWIPVRPGGDLALAMGMLRWIIENGRYDEKFLRNANKAAAAAAGEKSWTNATWLVNPETGKFLRASEIGIGGEGQFVVMVSGRPVAVDPYDTKRAVVGDLEVDTRLGNFKVKSSFQVLKDEVFKYDLDFYARESGVERKTIEDLSREFTSHGKRAAIDFYRGPIKFTYGYYAAQAIIHLNLLIGNVDHKGGLVTGGGKYNAMGGVFNLKKMHAGALTPFGIKNTREASGPYETSTLFKRDGYPAKRPWFPFTDDVYQEIVPAAVAGYPYPIKILWLHKGTPVLATPAGHLQIEMLKDPDKIPLYIADDIVIGETSMYADYVFPDLTYLERWAFEGFSPAIKVKNWKLRQPAAAPIPEIVNIDGEEMPISMESVMLAIAKKLGAPGYGKDGFAKGWDFNRPEDYYLKMVANVAMQDPAVPAASDAEIELLRKARRHLPKAVFDERKWQKAVGSGVWRQVVTVLNRGGRFEAWDKAYAPDGEFVAHTWGKLLNIYAEAIGSAVHSVTAKRLSGVPRYERTMGFDGKEIFFPEEYNLKLFTYKEIFGGQSRTVSNYAGQQAIMPENFVYISAIDARKMGLKDGDIVRVLSPDFDGSFEVAPGVRARVEGKVRVTQGIRPGSVAISWHYGHWAYGASEVEIDGEKVPGDPTRGRGLVPNPAMAVDPYLKDVCLTDPIAGDSAFGGTYVKLVKVGEARANVPPSKAVTMFVNGHLVQASRGASDTGREVLEEMAGKLFGRS